MKKYAFIILIATGLIACSKDKPVTVPSNAISDYFIIGHSPGFINVMTYNYYKIQGDFVFKADTLINGQYIYSSIPLSNYKFLIAKQAIDNLPQYLINNPNQYIGNRDFADQATYYVEMNKNNIKTYWILDPTATSVPAEVQNYVQLLANIISQL
jgi:hypothetical protein